MSTGAIWTNLPVSLALGGMHAFLPTVLGVWMFILGRGLWSPGPRLRKTLLWTHGILFAFGALAVYLGLHSVEAMERSTARGGGLLGPLAYIPLLFGLPIFLLAAFSLPVGLWALPADRTDGRKQEADRSGASAADSKPLLRLLLAWTLLAWGFTSLIPVIWPTSEAQKAAKQIERISARKKADIDALRKLSRRPPEKTAAVLRSSIMNGRLDVMRLTDQDATLALVTANLPVVFECIDILEAKNAHIMEEIEKRGGIRSWADREREDEHLGLTNSLSSLLTTLKDVTKVPASRERFLARRAAGKGMGRTAAISLIGKLDIPAEKRIALLMTFARDDDQQAANAARQALAQMGIQAEREQAALNRAQAERGKNPSAEAPSPQDDPPAKKIPDPNGDDSPRETGGTQTVCTESAALHPQPLFLVFTNGLEPPEVVAVSDPSRAHIVVEADFGVWQPEFLLQWNVFVDYGQIKVEQRMENSMSISDDGPHLDLLGWKHQYTAWKEMKRVGTNRWHSAAFTEDELTNFPPFTIAELKEQIRKQLKDFPEDMDRWLKLAETCNPPFDQACWIGASKAVIRLSTKKGAGWIEIKRIEVRLPMGC